ncbi:MAG: hypothetical protein AB7S71_14115 [Dongiaceae bacterium]
MAPGAAATAASDLASRLLWVIKLGGSLAGSPHLERWLAVIGGAGAAAIIVPGGGPFADQVRAAQRRLRFNDSTAHHMALLAMEQYGRMLAGLHPRLQLAASRRAIAQTRQAGSAVVWMPTRMVLDEPRIPASWDITSDSLAAWLAGQAAADRLVLVKSIALPGETVSATALADRGIVDPAFPHYVIDSAREVWCIDDARVSDMAQALRTGCGAGTRIVPTAVAPASIAGRRRRANIPVEPRGRVQSR